MKKVSDLTSKKERIYLQSNRIRDLLENTFDHLKLLEEATKASKTNSPALVKVNLTTVITDIKTINRTLFNYGTNMLNEHTDKKNKKSKPPQEENTS